MNTVKVSIKINKTWGTSGYAGFEILEVEINAEGRTNFRKQSYFEDGESYIVSRWEREDGQIDKYSDILVEAKSNGMNDWLN